MEEPVSGDDAAEIAALNAELASLAAGADLAQEFLLQLASALFPEGPPDTSRVTWPERTVAVSSDAVDGTQRAEAKLRAAEVRYRTLVEQIPAVTFMAVLGEGENEVYVSPHIETLLGFTQTEWLENPFLWYSQLHPDDRELWNEEFARGCRTGGPFRAECRFIARAGHVVWVRGEARVVKDDRGRPLFLQGVALDITESKRAEALLLREVVRTTEERYRDLVHGLGAVVWEAEPLPFQFTLVSRQAQEMLGFPPDRWIREPGFWSSRIHPADRDVVLGAWHEAIRGRSDHAFEYRVFAADGRLIWLQDTVRVIRSDEGQPRQLLGVMLDITARKHADEERAKLLAREQEARGESETLNSVGRVLAAELDFQKLVQSVTDAGTAVCGAAFGAFFYNVEDPAGRSYMLHTLSGAPRAAFAKFPHPRATPIFEPTFTGAGIVRCDDVTQDPRYGKLPPHLGLPAGHLPVRSYLAVPVTSRMGTVLGGLFFGHPEPGRFTERHERIVGGLAAQAAISMDNARLYEAAEKARQTAEDANRAKDEFLATMSHELRTPLNAVLGWARMLRAGQVAPAQASHALAVIERNALAQAQLVEDILDVSRIITGKLRLTVAPVNLVTVIEAALEVVRLAAHAKGIELRAALDPGAGAVHGDAGRLQQVIWNLLSNAVKFTPAGGRVLIRLEQAGGAARIVVTDTGSGIPQEFLPHVFDRFRQADSSTTRAHGGLGLGLAIVRHIVEQHGGHVRVDSAGLGQGATFTVDLPLHGSAAGTDAVPAAIGVPRTGVLAAVNVLVVDDEPDGRELTTALLQISGAEVVAVSSAAHALAAAQARLPDVVVTDIGMPEADGYALIRELRAGGYRGPAVALTAYGRIEDRERALAAGFDAHVAKPADAASLAEVIATVVATARGVTVTSVPLSPPSPAAKRNR
jgi:PAS domain S-box-containing protein